MARVLFELRTRCSLAGLEQTGQVGLVVWAGCLGWLMQEIPVTLPGEGWQSCSTSWMQISRFELQWRVKIWVLPPPLRETWGLSAII